MALGFRDVTAANRHDVPPSESLYPSGGGHSGKKYKLVNPARNESILHSKIKQRVALGSKSEIQMGRVVEEVHPPPLRTRT